MEKFATLDTTRVRTRRAGTRRITPRGRRSGGPLITGAFNSSPSSSELVEVCADHQGRLVGMALEDGLDHRDLGVRRRAQLVAPSGSAVA